MKVTYVVQYNYATQTYHVVPQHTPAELRSRLEIWSGRDPDEAYRQLDAANASLEPTEATT